VNINIDTFNNWAAEDKDLKMQKGHENAVDRMFELINERTKIFKSPFKFLDIGCGNGWAVRKALELENCILSEGVDGAPEMIRKAKDQDKRSTYYLEDIESWEPLKKYDIIFSMEVFYYFKNPSQIISKLSKYLEKGGLLIIGIDHYAENTQTLNWDKEYNISTNTFSIQNWKDFLINAGLKDVFYHQHGAKEDWKGTLIVLGNKKT
tara:strand:- start:221 stop:841 length:621 start_codon:yes stop_codon:yes gene_type:complete